MTTRLRSERDGVWPPARGRTAAWAGAAVGGLFFVALGIGTLFIPAVAAEFRRLGLSDGLRLSVGAVEVAGGVLVLRPRTWAVGVGALGAVFLVAACEQAWAGRAVPLVPLALVAAVAVFARARDRIAWWDRYAEALDRYAAEVRDGR